MKETMYKSFFTKCRYIGILWGIGFLFFTFSLQAQFDFLFTTQENFKIDAQEFTDDNILEYVKNKITLSSLLPSNDLPERVSIDAVSSLPGTTHVVFSLDEDVSTPYGYFGDEDLILFNGASYSVWFKGQDYGIPPEVNLNAVYIISADPKDFLFSLEENALLPGAKDVADEDIIRFQGDSFSLFLDGSEIGIPAVADVDAIGMIPDSSPSIHVFSLDSSAVIGGILYEDSDLIAYNGERLWKIFNAAERGLPPEVNLNCVDRVEAMHIAGWTLY